MGRRVFLYRLWCDCRHQHNPGIIYPFRTELIEGRSVTQLQIVFELRKTEGGGRNLKSKREAESPKALRVNQLPS